MGNQRIWEDITGKKPCGNERARAQEHRWITSSSSTRMPPTHNFNSWSLDTDGQALGFIPALKSC